MAKFVGVLWDLDDESWSVIAEARSADALADRLSAWMADNPPRVTTSIGVARVPSGMCAASFVRSLPAPDRHLVDCPLCRAGSPHSIH